MEKERLSFHDVTASITKYYMGLEGEDLARAYNELFPHKLLDYIGDGFFENTPLEL